MKTGNGAYERYKLQAAFRRQRILVAAWTGKYTYQQIGERFGVSKQRVGQIVRKYREQGK